MAETWAPALDDVARHIPRRTRNVTTPGSDSVMGTFTPNTTPTDDQAQAVIDAAVNAILSAAGPVPATGQPSAGLVQQAARSAAEWRAAADIELAYPNRDADVSVYQALDARAAAAFSTLQLVMEQTQTGTVQELPLWQAPPPPPWADSAPGSGTETIGSTFRNG